MVSAEFRGQIVGLRGGALILVEENRGGMKISANELGFVCSSSADPPTYKRKKLERELLFKL